MMDAGSDKQADALATKVNAMSKAEREAYVQEIYSHTDTMTDEEFDVFFAIMFGCHGTVSQ